MSFWDSVKKFAQPYADDDYDDYDDEDEYLDDYDDEVSEPARRTPSRRSAPAVSSMDVEDDDDDMDDAFGGFSVTSGVASSSGSAVGTSGFNGHVLNTSGPKQEVVLFRPTSFNDTSKAADDLRNRKAVVLNLENVDKAMARRVVDFLSGTVYAVEGSVKKIAQSAYLFCPHNMDVVGDLETIQAEVESYI